MNSIDAQLVFDAQKSEGIYDDDNQDSYDKARLFVKSIACGILQLNSSFSPVVNAVEVHDRLVELLTKYSIRFAVNDLTQNRINIFDERFRSNNELYAQNLLSVVFAAVNLLQEDERLDFVQQYVQQVNNLGRLLMIVNLIEGKTTKRQLHDLLDDVSLDEFINSDNLNTEWKDVLIEAVNSHDFFRFAEPLAQRMEERLKKREFPNENETHLLFEVQLLYAFKSHNWDALQSIDVPPKRHQHGNAGSLHSRKQFFVGLYKLYHDMAYEEAVNIFLALHSNNTGSVEYAYRLFQSRTMLAKVNDDSTAMKFAQDQWNVFLQTSSDATALAGLENNIRYTSLFSFMQFHEYVNIDTTLQSLPPSYRYDPEIVAAIFGMYQERQLDDLGFDYVSQARRYYAANYEVIPQVVEDLYSTIDDEKNISRLRISFNDIHSLPADKIIRTIPGKLNDGKPLEQFILNEIVRAGKILMEKVRSLSDIKLENKYNDLLQALLRFRLAVWGWNINDQGRTGESDSGGGDLGASDFKIECADQTIALIEALILGGKDHNKTEEHILKCNTYVTHTTRIYVVTYYKGKSENFLKSWNSYQQVVLTLNYPDTFKLEKKEFIEQNKVVRDIRNIKAALTRHVGGVSMYHIFLNISGG